MHRMDRMIWRGSLLAAAVALLSACGSSGTSTSTTSQGVATTVPSDSASPTSATFPIPNGTFDTTATREEALAKGFTQKEIDKAYGADGKQPETIVLDNGALTAIAEGDDGVRYVGSKGTYNATKKMLFVTEEGPGCPGCVTALRWSFNGNELSLKVVPRLSKDSLGPADLRVVRLYIEHEWVKAG